MDDGQHEREAVVRRAIGTYLRENFWEGTQRIHDEKVAEAKQRIAAATVGMDAETRQRMEAQAVEELEQVLARTRADVDAELRQTFGVPVLPDGE